MHLLHNFLSISMTPNATFFFCWMVIYVMVTQVNDSVQLQQFCTKPIIIPLNHLEKSIYK